VRPLIAASTTLESWNTGVLEYGNTRVLESWSMGVLEYQSTEIWESWSPGVPEYGNTGVLEYGSMGVLEHWSPGIRKYGSPGVLEYWSPGIREYGSLGVLESWSPGILEYGGPQKPIMTLQEGKCQSVISKLGQVWLEGPGSLCHGMTDRWLKTCKIYHRPPLLPGNQSWWETNASLQTPQRITLHGHTHHTLLDSAQLAPR